VRTEQGERIRRAFRAEDGFELVVADYSQIELRVLAHIAREPEMIAAFARHEDIHRSTAASVFGVAPELVTGEQRRVAKTINFGLIYGMSAFGLAQRLGIPAKDAERFIAAYFARFGGVQAYMKETLSGRARGQSRRCTASGGCLTSRARTTTCANAPPHGDQRAQYQGRRPTCLAMLAVDRGSPSTRRPLLLTVHDELVLKCRGGLQKRRPVATEMEQAEQLAALLVADAGTGRPARREG
jgi:DNA polymerase-1